MESPDMTSRAPRPAPRSSPGLDRSGDPARPSHGGDALLVTALPRHPERAELAGRERDALVLTAEERRWTRRRLVTRGGRALALALPTGTTLEPGALVLVEPERYVVVEAAPEPVLVVVPRSREEALRVAFEVGNRHFSLALDGERLLVPDDPAMEQLVARLAVRWHRERAPFVPLGAGHRHD
jgi:urease accessory protein UreE